jgi:G3E family GTPase
MTVPFTILTGFLGAGKTTALNRMLMAPRGRRIAVLVNELGRIAIDTRLILSRGGDVLELAGGCVCCKIDVKNDLWDGIAEVAHRASPDAIVLETTGIAEPPAILDGLARLPTQSRVQLAGVVSVVDAAAGGAAIDRREEARIQVECADRILLSKLDLATPEAVARVHERLAKLNPGAERASFASDDEGSRALTSWLLEVRARGRVPRARGHSHRHRQVSAAVYVDEQPLLPQPLLEVLERQRTQLLRVKGFVHLAGADRSGYLELAGERITLRPGAQWGERTPLTELVFIGEGLDEAALRRQLAACRARG